MESHYEPDLMNVAIVLLAAALTIAALAAVLHNAKDKAKSAAGLLDQSLFRWNEKDHFRVRDVLNGGVVILGRAGSGKTSSSGKRLAQRIVSHSHPRSAGLILAAKPEDTALWQDIFHQAGRDKDLILFDEKHSWRFNFLDYAAGNGGDTRNITQTIMTISETLEHGDGKGGGEEGRFFQKQDERLIYNGVAALQAAKEPISGPNLQRFIATAALNPASLGTPEWQAGYHNQILKRGFTASKTPIEAHDYQLAADYWLGEYPSMAEKTRSTILAGVLGMLHVFNTGIVREMISGATNVSPDDILAGKWVLVNFAPSEWGEIGSFICAGWKYLTQKAILQRTAGEGSTFVTVWADEAHQFINSFDTPFISQCRSHMGCLVYLTQSVSSFYAALQGEAGRHQVDALVANFTHAIVHCCDPITAKWAAAKLGRVRQTMIGGSMAPSESVWDELMGNGKFTGSFSEQYEAPLQDQEFMQGKTGGPANGFLCTAIVVRSGEPFAWGGNYLYVTFSQKR